MSSTNKTENISLNSWIGTDIPSRLDFNYDNETIDTVITEHKNDTISHITEDERDTWNNYMYTGVYSGNGSASRTVETSCPFDIRFAVVFANNRPLSIITSSDGAKHNYSGFASQTSNSSGISLSSDYRSLTVTQSSAAVLENEYVNLNEVGTSYCYILFR
ncbi:MAG: hypothetical protein LIO62_03470 [Clostridiales bacterium]|nr:hypothetical protein [Clostridiales bacterium]